MRPAAVRDDESGVTLIELVVSMTIMGVMMTMFTTAVVQMYQAANKTESMSNAQAELNNVFLRLDRIVRYAAGISNMQEADNRYYIGMLVAESDGKQRCYALQLTGEPVKRLEIADWYEAARPAEAPWVTIANDVVPPPSDEPPANGEPPESGDPFEVLPADADHTFDRLRLNLVATVGTNARSKTEADTKVEFTALNTSLASDTPTVCTYFWDPA
jgi:prepilin-type N-terminal cleavage/methylation domain-containing protein